MAKICPVINEPVLYLECLECDDKVCKKMKNENNIEKTVLHKKIINKNNN